MNTANTVHPQSSGTTDQVAGSAHEAEDRTAGGLSSTEQRVRAAAGEMSDALRTTTRRTRLQTERTLMSLRDYANRYPLAALGVAFGAGWLLSRFGRPLRR